MPSSVFGLNKRERNMDKAPTPTDDELFAAYWKDQVRTNFYAHNATQIAEGLRNVYFLGLATAPKADGSAEALLRLIRGRFNHGPFNHDYKNVKNCEECNLVAEIDAFLSRPLNRTTGLAPANPRKRPGSAGRAIQFTASERKALREAGHNAMAGMFQGNEIALQSALDKLL